MMAAPEETLPLRVRVNGDGPGNHDEHHGKKLALGATAAYLLVFTLICIPAVVPLWHPTYYAELGVEQRGWTWLGANALWLALALLWTLLHVDNGPCVATACLLCSVLWFYLSLVLLSQACRGQLPLLAVADALVHLTMLVVCFRAAWVGVAKKSQKARSDGTATWKRVLRKWALVSASATLFVSFCWRFWTNQVSTARGYQCCCRCLHAQSTNVPFLFQSRLTSVLFHLTRKPSVATEFVYEQSTRK